MVLFKQKSERVDAVQWTGANQDEIEAVYLAWRSNDDTGGPIFIWQQDTQEWMQCSRDWWIVVSRTTGRVSVVDPDTFPIMYEVVVP